MSTCKKCQKQHNRYRNKAHTQPASYCKDCHAQWMRENRPTHSELTASQRRKANCRSYANVYVKRGKIRRLPCKCGSKDSEMHHADDTKPLEIQWICRPCKQVLHVEPSR